MWIDFDTYFSRKYFLEVDISAIPRMSDEFTKLNKKYLLVDEKNYAIP